MKKNRCNHNPFRFAFLTALLAVPLLRAESTSPAKNLKKAIDEKIKAEGAPFVVKVGAITLVSSLAKQGTSIVNTAYRVLNSQPASLEKLMVGDLKEKYSNPKEVEALQEQMKKDAAEEPIPNGQATIVKMLSDGTNPKVQLVTYYAVYAPVKGSDEPALYTYVIKVDVPLKSSPKSESVVDLASALDPDNLKYKEAGISSWSKDAGLAQDLQDLAAEATKALEEEQ